jgi:hypothetical protein
VDVELEVVVEVELEVDVVEVGVVVDVVDEVVDVVGHVVVVVVDDVVVEVVVGVPVSPVSPVLAALLVSPARSTFDDAPGPLAPASDPSPTTAPRSVTATSAPTLHFRNLIGPPPIALAEFSTHRECPAAHKKVNSPRPPRSRPCARGQFGGVVIVT